MPGSEATDRELWRSVGLSEQGGVEQLRREHLDTDEAILIVEVEVDRGPDVLRPDNTWLDHVSGLQADVRRVGRTVVADTKHSVIGHERMLPDPVRAYRAAVRAIRGRGRRPSFAPKDPCAL